MIDNMEKEIDYEEKEKEKLIEILQNLEEILSKKDNRSIIVANGKYIQKKQILGIKINIKYNKNFVFYYLNIILYLSYAFNLLSILVLKKIMNNLWIVLENCFSNIFTPKIEFPDLLFNFYKIYLDDSKIPYLDFNLMMIMNFLGDTIYNICGFGKSALIYFIINILSFICLYNFSFNEFNEAGKYNFGKFIYLLFIYFLFFIGLGSFSLLPQKIAIEFNEKYDEYIKEKTMINNNENNEEFIPMSNYNEQNQNLISLNKLELSSESDEISIKSEDRNNVISNNERKKRTGIFYFISTYTLLVYYLFWMFDVNYVLTQILEINKLNYTYFNNITKEIGFYNESEFYNETIYEANKKIFFYMKGYSYAFSFSFSMIFYFFLLCIFTKKNINEKK